MTDKQTHIAVLTGDIIGSTQLAPGDLTRAFGALSACADTQAEWHGEDLHFTRQRGDGWQVRLARPAFALRSALAFRAALRCEGKEFSTFMAVAEGMAAPALPDGNLNAASDPVFIDSGRLLDQLKTRYLSNEMRHLDTGGIGAAFILADYISQSWTPAQAAAIQPMLGPGEQPSHSEIARALGKSRQAVSKALEGAGIVAFWSSLDAIEEDGAHNV